MGTKEIIVGTYEDYVVGYQVECLIKQAKEPKYFLEQSFAVRGHSGSVRVLASNQDGSMALSGGFDEMLNLFGLKKRRILQTIEAAVNCALFVGKSHLICGAENGNIYIYECKRTSMDLVKTLKGHKLGITSMSAHPSGKVLLSLSKDNTMRTWNLIKGRCAYVTQCAKSQPHLVCWSKSGDHFVIAARDEVYLYNKLGVLEHNFKLDKRINSIEFINNNMFVIASDSRLDFCDLEKGASVKQHEAAPGTRIKSINYLGEQQHHITSSTTTTTTHSSILFVTASSDGYIRLWSTDEQGGKLQELASTDTGARLTCMTSVIST